MLRIFVMHRGEPRIRLFPQTEEKARPSRSPSLHKGIRMGWVQECVTLTSKDVSFLPVKFSLDFYKTSGENKNSWHELFSSLLFCVCCCIKMGGIGMKKLRHAPHVIVFCPRAEPDTKGGFDNIFIRLLLMCGVANFLHIHSAK